MRLADNRGFTLVEILIALSIFAIGVLAVVRLQLASLQGNTKANVITMGTAAANSMIEEILALPYDNVLLDDTDNDGTGQDPDGDGVDNNGGNFGLDDATAATADHQQAAGNPDGPPITFFWNVAVDHPVAGAKTVNVITTWTDKGVPRQVSYSFVKAELGTVIP